MGLGWGGEEGGLVLADRLLEIQDSWGWWGSSSFSESILFREQAIGLREGHCTESPGLGARGPGSGSNSDAEEPLLWEPTKFLSLPGG